MRRDGARAFGQSRAQNAPLHFAQLSILHRRGHLPTLAGRASEPCGTIRSMAMHMGQWRGHISLEVCTLVAAGRCEARACIGDSGRKILVSVFGGSPFSTSHLRRLKRQRCSSMCSCVTSPLPTVPAFESKEASKISDEVNTAYIDNRQSALSARNQLRTLGGRGTRKVTSLIMLMTSSSMLKTSSGTLMTSSGTNVLDTLERC